MAEPLRHGQGFALVLVLGLVAIVGVLAAGSLHEALFGQALAGARQLQQRATSLADIGLSTALAQLSAQPAPADYTRQLQPVAGATDSVVVTQRGLGASPLAAGFSGGRFIARHYEIQVLGRSARGTRAVQTQGVQRILPLAAPQPVPPMEPAP